MGEYKGQGLKITSKSLWDVEFDNYASYTFKNVGYIKELVMLLGINLLLCNVFWNLLWMINAFGILWIFNFIIFSYILKTSNNFRIFNDYKKWKKRKMMIIIKDIINSNKNY